MDRPSKTDELATAWRALTHDDQNEGWRSIRIAAELPCHVRAARNFPGGTEALLLGFRASALAPGQRLPNGQGFTVERVQNGPLPEYDWFALSLRGTGNQPVFMALANDVLERLGACGAEEVALPTLLERLQDWQRFMMRSENGVLSREEEAGLFAELSVLETLLLAGLSPDRLLDAWRGPEGAAQDFSFGSGGVEVKGLASRGGLRAKISSLEQLDDLSCSPLFLAAVRLSTDDEGETLPECASRIREMLGNVEASRRLYDRRLAASGYLPAFAGAYSSRWTPNETIYFPVEMAFPRLTRTTVSTGIIEARYEIDLESPSLSTISLADMLNKLEVS